MEPSTPPPTAGHALICIGDRPLDAEAMRFACLITQASDLRPVLLHVQHPNTEPGEGEQALANARAISFYKQVEERLLEGNVNDQIRAELARGDYELLVLGTSQRPEHLPVSPLAKRLATQVQLSVLLIRNPPREIHRLLLCTGGHQASVRAVSWGIQLAQATQAGVTILHVASSPPAMYTGLPALEEDLQQLLGRDIPLARHLKEMANLAEEAGVEARLELRHGMVIEEILRSCEVQSHELIVIGAPLPRALLDQVVLGRVGPKLLASSLHSTLIVR